MTEGFRDRLRQEGRLERWSLALETRAPNRIPNETTDRGLEPNWTILQNEKRWSSRVGWRKRRDAVGAYNCFGLVFAGRRTGIYQGLEGTDIASVLEDDEYAELHDDADLKEDDIVIYYNEHDVPWHAARVVGFEERAAVPPLVSEVGTEPAQNRKVVMVLSKFSYGTGEYTHPLDEYSAVCKTAKRRLFTDRLPPTGGWRERIRRIDDINTAEDAQS